MAAAPIKVPSAGESISEGILARWLKPDGSAVKNGDALFELETDKASTTVTATSNGVLKIAVAEGTTVEVGSVVGSIDESATPTAAAAAPAAEPAKAAAPAAPVSASSNGGDTTTLAPSVRRIVAESNVDPSQVAGTGRDGRITKGDVIAHVEGKSAPAPAPTPAATPAPATPAPSAPTNGQPRETRKRMSGIRQKIAERLVEAQRNRRDPDDLQRGRHVAGHGPAQQVQGPVQGEARGQPRLLLVLRQGGDRGPQGLPRRQRPDRRHRHRLQQRLRHRGRRQHRTRADGPGHPERRSAQLRRHREGGRRLRRQGARGHHRGVRPRGRYLHDHQRRRLRLPALDADPQPAAVGHPRDARDPAAADRGRRPGRHPPDDVPRPLLRPPDRRRPRGGQLPGPDQGVH